MYGKKDPRLFHTLRLSCSTGESDRSIVRSSRGIASNSSSLRRAEIIGYTKRKCQPFVLQNLVNICSIILIDERYAVASSSHILVNMTDISTSLPIVWRETADPQDYEQARVGRVFNHRRPDRHPIAIVEAETEDHVVQAVKLAKKLNCRVSIRSGGHSWAVWSVRDDAVLIDLGKMACVTIDEERLVATVSPSTTGKKLDEHLSEKGLMFCGGHCPDVGLGGFLLQGGMGWNCRVCQLQHA